MAHKRTVLWTSSQPLKVFSLSLRFSFLVKFGIVLHDIIMGQKKKAACAAGRVADGIPGFRRHHVHHGPDQRAWGEILAGAGLCILGIFFQQPLVGIPLDVGAHHGPVFLVDQVRDNPSQFGRVLKFILGFVENQPQQAFFISQGLQQMTIVVEQFIPVFVEQAAPTII